MYSSPRTNILANLIIGQYDVIARRAATKQSRQMERQFFVYILTNSRRTVLDTGVTGDLIKRIHQHRTRMLPGFASRYNVDRLVFYEILNDAVAAIAREKQIKGGSRAKKVALIAGMNPQWRDLLNDLL